MRRDDTQAVSKPPPLSIMTAADATAAAQPQPPTQTECNGHPLYRRVR